MSAEMDENKLTSPFFRRLLMKLWSNEYPASGIISLRLLEAKPKYDPMTVVDYFFNNGEFKELPLYSTSFFPLFFTGLERSCLF